MLSGRRPAGTAAVVAMLLCLLVTAAAWPQHSARADRPRRAQLVAADPAAGFAIVGHRGYPARDVTENTVPSFRRAVRYGATAVELDVQLTRDGRLLVMHDPTLDRTTTCRGRVAARTLAAIQQRCRGRRGHELVPSLGQVLGLVVRLGTDVVVDVKRPPASWSPARYHRLVDAIRSRGLVDRTVVLGFHRANLEAIRHIEPGLRVQGIASTPADVARIRTWADGLNLPASLATPELVGGLRDQGLLVLGRKTSLARDWSVLRESGADGLLTDSLASYGTWVARQGPATSPTPTPTPTPTPSPAV
ncbi:glycerophosphodiester phosphodiesterase [Nocardioides marmoribigeumensis]|uniref:Glycerophosphoryl diester phosphodiesterase n=1 Tax=Nocardioides marmoribigeumensis TaxID=433649 RepID=A0ABU2BUZ0_9ACTN|nr:glycerophosphodiester phosphodiesterase family protein [Nocardioides marmoribigeumensis]MDR7362453.1 glycerophosphoryl diester phosphodiesterase [Nocardioides marmoribigeumensis]